MASRIVFASLTSGESFFREDFTDFEYYRGMAISQKRKCIRSLHDSYLVEHPTAKLLEISSKSETELGNQLSAFNLSFTDDKTGAVYCVENVYQCSKVFENGRLDRKLLEAKPKEARAASRDEELGKLIGFRWKNWHPTDNTTMFYDWLYCKALSQHSELVTELITKGYNAFTDIAYNHKVSMGCQARSAAIFVSLCQRGLFDEYLNNRRKWRKIYR